MSNLLILKELIKDKNLGIPYFFYYDNYNNLKTNHDINFSINKNDIINDNEYNKILEYNLIKNNKLKTKKNKQEKKNKKSKKIKK